MSAITRIQYSTTELKLEIEALEEKACVGTASLLADIFKTLAHTNQTGRLDIAILNNPFDHLRLNNRSHSP
jgi:hypothetical protein